MKNKKSTIIAWTLMISICCSYWVWADLTFHTEELLDSLILALDSKATGDFTDETWYTDLTGKISSLAEDSTPELGGDLDQNGHLIKEDSATAFTDSDAPSPDLSSAHQIITFTDDGTADITTLSGFSNIPIGVVYSAEFTDALWEVDFSGTNLEGHGGNDWYPRAGDSMSFYTTDGTTIVCTISAATSLSVTKYYEMPFNQIPTSDDSWSGPTAEYLAGETLTQWDLVYVTHDTGTPEIKKWDADLATYKAYKPIGVVIESGGITDTETGTVGVLWGFARNDGWTFTDNQDEGLTVYGTTTAGAISVTAPSTAGDIVCAVGIVHDEDEIMFNFGLCASVEVSEVP
jgi:hypothetical protein